MEHKMKILVTGANGYLGQGIVKAILDNGHKVIACDFSDKNIDSRAERIVCNMFETLNPYEEFGEPDCLLHLAWRDGFVHNSDAHFNDLAKHCQFLQKMLSCGLKKVAVMGTMHEIGFFEGSINETTPCHPQTCYGIAKNALRDYLQMIAKQYNAEWKWLRGYYIVGNSGFGNSIFSKITAAEKEGKTEFPFTMGQNQYDFLNYEDFCQQVAAAVGQSKINGVINICSGRPEKLADRVERFIKENNYKINLKYGAFPDREYDSKAVWGNDAKIREILANEEYKA